MDGYQNEVVYMSNGNNYQRIDGHHASPHHRRCIDGKITGCGNCVGYCQYSEHPGYLTKELRKRHDCINKGCYHYIPKTPVRKESNPFSVLASMAL